MAFLLLSFVAGLLTVLAPCVLPLLPVIIGGAAVDARSRWKPYVITASLAVSVVVFTLLLKFATLFINIPQYVWWWVSGAILIFFGLITLFPDTWEKVAAKGNLVIMRRSNELLATGAKKESFWGDIIIGASLGPVFSSCSPTYFVILATVLPQSFAMGFVDLVAYAIGLSLALLAIALLGQRLVGKLAGVSDPHGWVKKTLGVIFILVGIFVISGFSTAIQTYFLNSSSFDITKFETKLLQSIEGTGKTENIPLVVPDIKEMENDSRSDAFLLTPEAKALIYPKYREIENPSGFVNSEPFKLADLIGKKVILLDMMTYSCINCQRTFPYLAAWYKKYKDMGLEIVAIHTPEFAFEKKKENVEAAFRQFGLTFPTVLDNNYGTWNAYGNQYWPHKYLIDIDGFVRYDHIGEGSYKETEEQIKAMLEERAVRLGEKVVAEGFAASAMPEKISSARSKETYFGAYRNQEFFGNGEGRTIYTDTFALPKTFPANQFFLGGKWRIEEQYIESEEDTIVAFAYDAKEVYLVAEATSDAVVSIQNGNVSNQSTVTIREAKLYTIVSNPERQSSVFYLNVPRGVRLYALTFG
ncbi:MAG: cytochrome c biogenesis protein CcdA [Candidatus Paceibacterota bacterium]|jgi:cytochrome c biogenesis protein CcdA/thiol-disulfide isomerase/thioredoxin